VRETNKCQTVVGPGRRGERIWIEVSLCHIYFLMLGVKDLGKELGTVYCKILPCAYVGRPKWAVGWIIRGERYSQIFSEFLRKKVLMCTSVSKSV
jgi:hypothetical protein